MKDDSGLTNAASALGGVFKKAAAAWVVGSAAAKTGRQARDWWTAQHAYTVQVASTDPAWGELNRWLLSSLPPEKQRALTAVTNGTDPLRLLFDSSRRQTITVDGHRVTVDADSEDEYVEGRTVKLRRLKFTTRTRQGQQAVVAKIAELAASADTQPRMFRSDRWGNWRNQGPIPPRPESTVVLNAGVWESIVDDITVWRDSRDRYQQLGIPWRRGLVLHGPPGTGKTSICKALANRFQMNLHVASLTTLEDDDRLAELFDTLRPNALVVIEDIDVLKGSQDREKHPSEPVGVTLSGLLNTLDGIGTPEGTVTVMTTNRLDALDPALIRPGRADLNVAVGHLTTSQAERLVTGATGGPWHSPRSVEALKITPAEVLQTLHRHINDPDAARQAVTRMLDAA